MERKVLERLLNGADPCLRYRTLVWLLEEDAEGKKGKAARKEALRSPVVRAVLKAQKNEGWWISERALYSPTYKGTLHQLVLLAELGVPGDHPAIEKACEFVLGRALIDGGVSCNFSPTSVIPCMSGNILWAMIQFGRWSDPRVQSIADWLVTYQRCDDGDRPSHLSGPLWPSADHPSKSHYRIHGNINNCWSSHSCHMGVVKTLWGLSAIPADARSAAVERKMDELREYILMHRLYQMNHHGFRPMRPGWEKFGFPRFIYTDALDIARIICQAGGIGDPRADDVIRLIHEKRGANGMWRMETSFNGKMWRNIERKGSSSGWITLHALYVLKERAKAMKKGKMR